VITEAFFMKQKDSGANRSGSLQLPGKVYFIEWHYDVKLQGGQSCPLECGRKAEPKAENTIKVKMKKWLINT
jgi:hypothetical protein